MLYFGFFVVLNVRYGILWYLKLDMDFFCDQKASSTVPAWSPHI